MREPREEGQEAAELDATPEAKRKAGRPPKAIIAPAPAKVKPEAARISNPYSIKIEFKKYEGDVAGLPSQQFNSKGNPLKESKIDLLKRSLFFANYVNGRYKIIMVYKGRGENKHHARFDIVNPKKDKAKIAFFKSKGIIF
jgi:hypothetical protein